MARVSQTSAEFGSEQECVSMCNEDIYLYKRCSRTAKTDSNDAGILGQIPLRAHHNIL